MSDKNVSNAWKFNLDNHPIIGKLFIFICEYLRNPKRGKSAVKYPRRI